MTELLAGPALARRADDALAVPLQHALGARLLDPADPTAGVRFTVADLATNGSGGLHGGALSGVLELAGYLALLPHLAVAERAVIYAVATQLLAAAKEGDGVEVRGALDRRTRRLAFFSSVEAALAMGSVTGISRRCAPGRWSLRMITQR